MMHHLVNVHQSGATMHPQHPQSPGNMGGVNQRVPHHNMQMSESQHQQQQQQKQQQHQHQQQQQQTPLQPPPSNQTHHNNRMNHHQHRMGSAGVGGGSVSGIGVGGVCPTGVQGMQPHQNRQGGPMIGGGSMPGAMPMPQKHNSMNKHHSNGMQSRSGGYGTNSKYAGHSHNGTGGGGGGSFRQMSTRTQPNQNAGTTLHQALPQRVLIQPAEMGSAKVGTANMQSQPPMMAACAPLCPIPENVGKAEGNNETMATAMTTTGTVTQLATETSVNMKEKTPMCLVNELARLNKIQHQYHLTSEQGPAHKKRFNVTLKLGDEEYTSDGPSIKKAQHSAASDAISKTKYKHPPTKSHRSRSGCKAVTTGNITPTVELNALAMKLGESPIYAVEPASAVNGGAPGTGSTGTPTAAPAAVPAPQQSNVGLQNVQQTQSAFQSLPPQHQSFPNNQYVNGWNYHHRNNPNMVYQMRYQSNSFDRRSVNSHGYGKYDYRYYGHGYYEEPLCVSLTVGQRKFHGIGNTLQAARHDAASKALKVFKPMEEKKKIVATETSESGASADESSSELKSPISLVHEVALKRSMTVSFEVVREKGPPHMKIFVTTCRVGETVIEGEGNGKKISKKRAAEKMLEELKKLPPSSPVQKVVKQKRKPQVIVKKKSRNLIKEKQEPEWNEEINPISRLIQIQQLRKEREPVYTVLEERGAPRRREFVIQVTAASLIAQGCGPNKKMAKRNAAECWLELLGDSNIVVPDPSDKDKKEKDNNGKSENSKKPRNISFPETTATSDQGQSTTTPTATNRQPVPGLIFMQNATATTAGTENTSNGSNNAQNTSTIAKDLLNVNGAVAASVDITASKTSATVTPITPITPSPVVKPRGVCSEGIRPENQLMYLAQLLNFEVKFDDFHKGNHSECLTVVSLVADPPLMSHGTGSNVEESHDQAAKSILKSLSELGIDNIKPIKVVTAAAAAAPAPETATEPSDSGGSDESAAKPILSTN